MVRIVLVVVALLSAAMARTAPACAQQPGSRFALVIGNGAYPGAPLATAANDAGLVAQTLTAAGFDVTGARDLDAESLRRAFRDFLEKGAAAGPDGTAFVYLSGYALQFDGDNFFVPVDASLARDTDIPLQAIRLSDFTRALGALPLRARVVVVDGAYKNPSVPPSDHVAEGLALVDPEPGSLIAFNAAPGTVGAPSTGTYGVYGQAMAEMMRAGGVPVDEVFDRVRLRVNETTRGADVPWDASKLTNSFMFLERAPDAPAVDNAQQSFSAMSRRPIREFPVEEAYNIAVARDDFQGYGDFLAAYPESPYAARIRRLLAVRREALIWRRTVGRNSPDAYWTYQRRYPRGPHLYDARRRLAILSAALQPPSSFPLVEFDVPPPPEVEYDIVDQPTVFLSDPDYPPPPPPPILFLPPQPTSFVDLPPPPPPVGPGFLPIPVPIPIPYSRPIFAPGQILPPRGFSGGYAQPRPFARGPGGGLVPQALPQGTQPQPGVQSNLPPNLNGLRPNLPANRPGLVSGAPGAPGTPGINLPGQQQGVGRPLPQGARPPVGQLQRPAGPSLTAPQVQPLPGQQGLRPGAPGALRPAAPAAGQALPVQPGLAVPRQQALPGQAVPRRALPIQGGPNQKRNRALGAPLPGAAGTPSVLRPTVPALPNAISAPNRVRPVAPLPAVVPNGTRQAPPAAARPLQQPPQPNALRLQQEQLRQQLQNVQQRQQDQQRAQQQNQQRQQDQQRVQQQNQQRQQEQQRAQQQNQQRQQEQNREPPRPRQDCGHPGQPPCR